MKIYEIVGAGEIWSEDTNSKIDIITNIKDYDDDVVFKPSQHPTIWDNVEPYIGYLSPFEWNEGSNGVCRIISLGIFDKQGRMQVKYTIPDSEMWVCEKSFWR